MKTTFLRTLLTFGSLMILASFAMAQQRGIRSAFALWPDDEKTSSSDLVTQEAASAPNELTMEEQVAGVGLCTACSYDDDPSDGLQCDPLDDGSGNEDCTCDSCDSGCHGDGCCGDGCCDGCLCGTCGDGCGCDCHGCGGENYCGDCSNYDMNAGMYYAEIQNMFMRAHVSSDVIDSKLREKYEWSPRIVLGYESPGGLGGRMRWWSYSRTTTTLDDDSLRFELDVLDAEGTARFSSGRADLLIAGGFRFADFSIEEDDDEVDAQMPGITFAADGRMAICRVGCSQWSGVCGARWSILGGDWRGDDNAVIDATFDDNITAQEIYGGFEYLCHKCNYDLYARIVFEMQNWHSDAIDASSDTNSIGFVGPAIHGGVSF